MQESPRVSPKKCHPLAPPHCWTIFKELLDVRTWTKTFKNHSQLFVVFKFGDKEKEHQKTLTNEMSLMNNNTSFLLAFWGGYLICGQIFPAEFGPTKRARHIAPPRKANAAIYEHWPQKARPKFSPVLWASICSDTHAYSLQHLHWVDTRFYSQE